MFAPNQFLLSRDGDVGANLSGRAEETHEMEWRKLVISKYLKICCQRCRSFFLLLTQIFDK